MKIADDNILDIQRSFEDALGVPVYEGNAIQVLKNGDEIFSSMLAAIGSAERTIEFLTHVYWEGDIAKQFASALAKKSRQGLRVNIILDAFGCQGLPKAIIETMHNAGVGIEWFRPLLRWKIWKANHRTHRKILVCDRAVAFTGGVGIADEWQGDAQNPSEWRDTHFRIEGPAVSSIFSGFVENWLECGRPLSALRVGNPPVRVERKGHSAIQILRSPASYGWTDFATVVRLMLTIAQRNINITTAYFNPDRATIDLLRVATDRDVTINILVPGMYTDQKIAKIAGEAKYESLLEAGITIRHYQRTMLHAKIFSVDGRFACVGSPNFNQRSMRKDDELGMTLFDPQVVEILDAHFKEDMRFSEKIDLVRWQTRGVRKRALEFVVTRFEKEI